MDLKASLASLRSESRKIKKSAAYEIVDHFQGTAPAKEVAELAVVLAESGSTAQLDGGFPYADVVSTGGTGSISTLLCPILLAAVGVKVPKISSAGSMASSIDVLSLLEGYRSYLSLDEFLGAVSECGIARTSNSSTFCPDDGFLQSIRLETKAKNSPALVAASLFSKVLGGGSPPVVFDLRVGLHGNIGEDLQSATESALLFAEVGRILRIRCDFFLTSLDFPCSAYGRYEALDLLHNVLTNEVLIEQDRAHIDMCIRLAARACVLAFGGGASGDYQEKLRASIANGRAYDAFIVHVNRQGSSSNSLDKTLRERLDLNTFSVKAMGSGYWRPPEYPQFVSQWKKLRYRIASIKARELFGLRLIASPGQWVKDGQPIIEVRYSDLDFPSQSAGRFREFEGRTSDVRIAVSPPVIVGSGGLVQSNISYKGG